MYLQEFIYDKGLTNPEIAFRIKAIIAEHPNIIISADSAEPKSITEIRQHDIPIVPTVKGPDSVINGIQRIKQYKVHVHPDSINIWKEYQNYKWKEDKDGNLENEPVDYMNHAMDAIRYGVIQLKGKAEVGLQISRSADYEREQRKEKLRSENYDPLNDNLIWSNFMNEDTDE